jgi:hypothetical protein
MRPETAHWDVTQRKGERTAAQNEREYPCIVELEVPQMVSA